MFSVSSVLVRKAGDANVERDASERREEGRNDDVKSRGYTGFIGLCESGTADDEGEALGEEEGEEGDADEAGESCCVGVRGMVVSCASGCQSLCRLVWGLKLPAEECHFGNTLVDSGSGRCGCCCSCGCCKCCS